jgi:hypothetical protein
MPRVIHHGLAARVVPGTPDTWRLVSQGTDSLFPLFYDVMIGTGVPLGTEFDARRLLGYVSAIGWQLEQSGAAGLRGCFPCKWVIVTHETAGCWDILAVPRKADLARLPAAFDAQYDEVGADASRGFAYRILNMHAAEANEYRFLQRKVPVPSLAPHTYDVVSIEQSLKQSALN